MRRASWPPRASLNKLHTSGPPVTTRGAMSPASPHSYGIYVHAPWCRARCPYCAFNVEVSATPDVRGWLDGLHRAWSTEAAHFTGPAHSLYLGGGTPSLLPPSVVSELVQALPLLLEAEVTLEANPGTVDRPKLEALVEAGVTRLSIGVQSLQPPVAKRLGRGHTVHQAQALLETVGQLGLRSWSFDLIFGVPGQTMALLEADLAAIIDTAPPHVSLYGLTIEPGTPFARMEAAGTLRLPDGDLWRRQYDRIVQTLSRHGWERYEVSNFAKPGHRGVHNEQLWRGGWYAGLGPGAHGFRPDGTRTTTEPDSRRWMADPAGRATCPSSYEAAVDHLLSTLRHREGTTHQGLWSASRHRLNPEALFDLDQAGLITPSNLGIRLTDQGFALADGILRRLTNALSS